MKTIIKNKNVNFYNESELSNRDYEWNLEFQGYEKEGLQDFENTDTTWFFEYDNDNVTPETIKFEWDANNPSAPGTRFFRPGYGSIESFIVTSDVFIDAKAPTLVKDETEYTIYKEPDIDVNRNFSYTFKDSLPIDTKTITIETPTKILYKLHRTTTDIKDVKITNFKYEKSSENYKLSFTIENEEDDLEDGLTIKIYDIAGNYTILDISKTFHTINLDQKISDLVLEPVVIEFTDIFPEDLIVTKDVTAKTKVIVRNINKNTSNFLKIKARLTKESEGSIYTSTINYNELEDEMSFVVINIHSSKPIIVEGWLEHRADVPESTQNEVFNYTYKQARLNFLVAGEGRLYKLKPYVPSYLKDTHFYDFVVFTEKYLNTIYSSMSNDVHISGLEKIARINNFNDIALLENKLINRYASEHGMEFDIDLSSLLNSDSSSFNTSNLTKFSLKDENDVYNLLKYVLENLPEYNKYKGTYDGIQMALKMFGFSCKIINLWVKKDPEIEEDPIFIKEDDLPSGEWSKYFMSSRFDIDVNPEGSFNFLLLAKNFEVVVKLVKSIKPITKILNKVRYKLEDSLDTKIIYRVPVIENELKMKYTITWKLYENNTDFTRTDYYERFQKYNNLYNYTHAESESGKEISNNLKVIKFWLGYEADVQVEYLNSDIVPKNYKNCYAILNKLLKYNTTSIRFYADMEQYHHLSNRYYYLTTIIPLSLNSNDLYVYQGSGGLFLSTAFKEDGYNSNYSNIKDAITNYFKDNITTDNNRYNNLKLIIETTKNTTNIYSV